MKQFISKVKNLSQKAAEIKAAMQQLPPKVAEVRDAVAATTGQLRQLKSEIHYSVADLKADDEDRLSEAMQELNASAEDFEKAGFTLRGVDLEISPVQRLLVRLAKKEEVHSAVLRSLTSANQQRRTVHAILSAMLQAKQMGETVKLDELNYCELIVGIGPIPSVRLCWRAAEPFAGTSASFVKLASAAEPAAASGAGGPSPASVFGQSSFFEKRPIPSPAAAPVVTAATPLAATAPAPAVVRLMPVPAATPEAAAAPGGNEDPLARFKKMPDFTKYRK